MTLQSLKETIEKLDREATPGPWASVEPIALDWRDPIVVTSNGESTIAVGYGGGPVKAISGPTERANTTFIAFARTALPQLLRIAEELEDKTQWRPIETAPKDGTEILGWREDAGVLLIKWTCPDEFLPEEECEKVGDTSSEPDWFYADFAGGGRLEGSEVPTHWMQVPTEALAEIRK